MATLGTSTPLRWQFTGFAFLTSLFIHYQAVSAFTSSKYQLDSEFSGRNFFNDWDFFTDADPTHGFVTYFDQSSAQYAGLISAPSDSQPAYIGVDHTHFISSAGAGRASVRISSKRSWTHGLFIGDFEHIPAGSCGTWPAFWTLGPQWPAHGEIDIMEGVSDIATNAISLHTNETCKMAGNKTFQSGLQGNADCAYYPGDNIGCGVVDKNTDSYSDFNNIGGGVYAMQWTSEYIRVWFWPRGAIPKDIIAGDPSPVTWGEPVANMESPDCLIDQHFQQHRIVIDNTFCGDYAGSVWSGSTCQRKTGYTNCNAYVAANPAAFVDSYWSINSVRVYQLVNPTGELTSSIPYIASLQPTETMNINILSPKGTPTALLCPTYNFSLIVSGNLTYEIECDFDIPGIDLSPPPNTVVKTFEDCITGCNYWNLQEESYLCSAVSYDPSGPSCYYKSSVSTTPKYRAGFQGARLMFYNYPLVTDDPTTSEPTSYPAFIETIPVPETYAPPAMTIRNTSEGVTSTVMTSLSAMPTHPIFNTTSIDASVIGPGMGVSSNSDSISSQFIVPTITISLETVPTTGSIYETSSLSIPATLTSSSVATSYTQPPGPMIIDDFHYAGCKGLNGSHQSFILTQTSGDMSIEFCINYCRDDAFVGIHGGDCYCTTDVLAVDNLLDFPATYCDDPCPGRPGQFCGGIIPFNDSDITITHDDLHAQHRKRHSFQPDSILLLTIYNNTGFGGNTSDTNAIMKPTSIDVDNKGSSNTQVLPSKDDLLLGASTSSITFTRTVTAYAISTIWHDYCSTCSEFATTQSTTVTALGFGDPINLAIALPLTPTIPMIEIVKACACGADGAASTTTVTIPCEREIAALTSSLNAARAAGSHVTIVNLATAQPPIIFAVAAITTINSLVGNQFGALSRSATKALKQLVVLSLLPDTVIHTLTLQSASQSASQTPAVAVRPMMNRIGSPVIPIIVSGSSRIVGNASYVNSFHIPVLSQPHSSSTVVVNSSLTPGSGNTVASSAACRDQAGVLQKLIIYFLGLLSIAINL